ncbi:MAG TPA: 30S ribosomal protein S1 [Candidatus Angelobacter sp.]|nr:30S ribosomal protein S1 [Candidatus Angelobacter sp.]
MSNPDLPESNSLAESTELDESFDDMLSQYEKSHSQATGGGQPREGTVIALTPDSVILDIGFKTEGVLPLTAFPGQAVKPGDRLPVTVKGRNAEGYYELSRGRVAQPKDWESLERAFAEKTTISGTVIGVVKGGLSVDVGVRAFLPASRSRARDAAEMEKLVGQEIRCRIIKLDVADEDVVVDRRVVAEAEELAVKERRYSEIKEGETVRGTVRSLAAYGAFVDIGEVDALLHVSDLAWSRVSNPADVLSVGQEVEVKILKITTDPGKQRISVGMKQLQPHPWDSAAEKYKAGERVRGTVTRVTDFGAFVELEPGIEGLVHVSEMSWIKKVRRPSDVVKPGETVEAVILGVNAGERRLSLGLKQTLGDPWADAAQRFPVGSVVEGPVTSLAKFGAFVELAEGIEGMIHISDISAEKRLNHPQEMLKVGQRVKAQVLELDLERRRVKLGIKQMAPSSLDEYFAEHKPGDVVSGRVVEVSGGTARVELGEGVYAPCRLAAASAEKASASKPARKEVKADLSSLSSMLQARWKSGGGSATSKPESARSGEIRSFRIVALDAAAKKIELEEG